MSLVCGNCGESISDPEDTWPEVQCERCGAYNKIVPECAIKNPQNPSQTRFGEYLNYPSRHNDNYAKVNAKQFEKIIKNMPYITPIDELIHTLDYLYQVNTEHSIDWLGTVSSVASRFPANVMAMEILGNMNSPRALEGLVSNVSFDYLRESLKSSNTGHSLFSAVVQSMAAYSNNQYTDINFAEFMTASYIPARAIVAVPELIRTVQVELFRLTKAVNVVKRFGGKIITPVLQLTKSRDRRKNQEIEAFISFMYLSLNYTNNSIFTVMKNLLTSPIKRDGDYVKLIMAGDVMVNFSKENPENTTYYELINSLLTHKDPRVRIGVASSIFYKDFRQFTKPALEHSLAFHSYMVEAMIYGSVNPIVTPYLEMVMKATKK